MKLSGIVIALMIICVVMFGGSDSTGQGQQHCAICAPSTCRPSGDASFWSTDGCMHDDLHMYCDCDVYFSQVWTVAWSCSSKISRPILNSMGYMGKVGVCQYYGVSDQAGYCFPIASSPLIEDRHFCAYAWPSTMTATINDCCDIAGTTGGRTQAYVVDFICTAHGPISTADAYY